MMPPGSRTLLKPPSAEDDRCDLALKSVEKRRRKSWLFQILNWDIMGWVRYINILEYLDEMDFVLKRSCCLGVIFSN